MRKVFLTLLTTLLAGCLTAPLPPAVNPEFLKSGGYVFASMKVGSDSCRSTLIVRKIESQNPLKLSASEGGIITTDLPGLAEQINLNFGFIPKAAYFPAGKYGIVNATCFIPTGNGGSKTYTLGHGGTMTMATFDVKQGEAVDLGMLTLDPIFKGFILMRNFSHIGSRVVVAQSEATIGNFKQKNPSFVNLMSQRYMVATPVLIRPESEPQ